MTLRAGLLNADELRPWSVTPRPRVSAVFHQLHAQAPGDGGTIDVDGIHLAGPPARLMVRVVLASIE